MYNMFAATLLSICYAQQIQKQEAALAAQEKIVETQISKKIYPYELKIINMKIMRDHAIVKGKK